MKQETAANRLQPRRVIDNKAVMDDEACSMYITTCYFLMECLSRT